MRRHSGDLPFGHSNVGCARLSAIRRSETSGDARSSVERDQVLEDQVTPAFPARMHKQSTFRKPTKLDRRETEFFRKRRQRFPKHECYVEVFAGGPISL